MNTNPRGDGNKDFVTEEVPVEGGEGKCLVNQVKKFGSGQVRSHLAFEPGGCSVPGVVTCHFLVMFCSVYIAPLC